MAILSRSQIFTSSGGIAGQAAIEDAAITTIYLIGDTHYGGAAPDVDGEGNVVDPNDRQVFAINNTLFGKSHPLGGVTKRPSVVIQLGDAKHEDTETVNRLAANYTLDGSGNIKYPCYILDGNHDQSDVRDLIVARHGSLNWGVKIGPCWFQAITENYTAPLNTTPPTAAQIEAVGAAMNRPDSEPTFFMFHRALSGGYLAEWASDALDALEDLANSKNTLAILHGHDHYSQHITWRGIRAFSPGSVAMAPMAPPYSTIYPESIAVLRIGTNWFDVASYLFGYNTSRAWTPGVWEWSERMSYDQG